MIKSKYYVVNNDSADWYTNLAKAIKEIKKGYFGDDLTRIYDLSNIKKEYDNDFDILSNLSFDDEIMEFENCKLIKDYR